jgi:hypothetical protein
MSGSPAIRGQHIVEPGRQRVFRRQGVLDRKYDDTRSLTQQAAEWIVRLDRADHPAAAMRVNQHRQRHTRIRRRVEPSGHARGDRRVPRPLTIRQSWKYRRGSPGPAA